MRCPLAVLIAVVQVAGSWLCCCGPDRLVGRPAAEFAAVPVSEPASACPHCKAAADAPRPERPQPDQTKSPHRCPCGGKAIEAVRPAADTAELARADLLLSAPVLTALDVALPLPAAEVTSAAGLCDLPFLPGEARLFAHHVLRC